ncbi:Hsp20/alpha crystallin family protein [Brevundimonas sp.]|uniref:Hsp20/alpha crystallin family protein n=1 Tax=Brevundimonas sp. TaxID=1871086 RepID=UPI002D5CF8AD|nr:Hsp20/alpha crystallin family protein [Brevundimonas sp.]HYC97077.1 Hsp20/alpha crystallin family protein [Brevundimonas sp.]
MRNLTPWGRNDRAPAMTGPEESANPIVTLHREMNRMFDSVLRGFDTPLGAVLGGGISSGGPSLDVDETDKEYRVTAELPGLAKDDVEITCQDGVLVIRGEKQGEKREGRAFSERWFGRFERQISLPDADEERANASFRDGLLTVTIPKTERAQQKARRIPINDASATTH